MLILYVFNLFGYRIFFDYAGQQQDYYLERSFDKNQYDENGLVQIRLALYNPYQMDWPDYQRLDGEIKIDGRLYKYVKGKVTNGELIILCAPNTNKTQLQVAKNDFFKTASNLHNSGEQGEQPLKSPVFKNALVEFDECWHNGYCFNPQSSLQKFINSGRPPALHPGSRFLSEEPPDRV